MMHRFVPFFLAICSLLPAACAKAPKQSPKPVGAARAQEALLEDTSQLGSLVIRRVDYPAVPLLKVPQANGADHVRSLYRIKPDHRVLYALAEIPRILSGAEQSPLLLRFESGMWQISMSGEPIGSLAAIPTYNEARKLLGQWAARQIQKHPFGPGVGKKAHAGLATLGPELTSGDSKRTIEALRKLNERWRKAPASPEIVEAGARGFAWLSVQLIDDLDQADTLLGRALAFVVLADAAAPDSVKGEEALLCAQLGYESASRVLAAALPPSSRDRAFVLDDKEALSGFAKGGPKDEGSQYLYLLSTAVEKKLAETAAPPAGQSLSALKAWRSSASFSTRLPVEESVLRATWAEVGVTPPSGNLESGLADFEQRTAAKARSLAGPVLDAGTYTAFYRAAAYAAMLGKVQHLLDQWSVTDEGERYARSIDPAAGTAAELQQWVLDRVACRKDTRKVGLLNDDFSSLRQIGLFPLERIRFSVQQATQTCQFVQRKGMPAYFRRLDSRPAALSYAAEAARWNLHDLELEETFLRALDRTAPRRHVSGSVRLALLTRDAARLREIAAGKRDQEGAKPWGRSLALENLADVDPTSGAEILAGFRDLVTQFRNDGAVFAGIRTLEKLKDPARALELVRLWRSHRTGAEDLTWVEGVVHEARLLRKLGRLDEAHNTVQQVVPSGKHSALTEAIDCLMALSRLEEASDLARKALERYPEGSSSYATLAEVLWRMNRDDEAAEELKKGLSRYEATGSWTIGEALTRAFEGKSAQRTSRAVSALQRSGVDGEFLFRVVTRLVDGSDHRKAFEILTDLPYSGAAASQARINAYKELVKADGADAALEWMRSVTPGYDSQLAIVLVQWGPHELFLDLFHNRPGVEKADPYLNMRAATLVYLRRGNDPRRDEILRAVHERQKGNHDERMTTFTRYLLHEVDETALPTEFGYPGYVSSIGWIRGLRAAEGRKYREANAWFQVALESDQDAYPPTGFACAPLYRWQEANKSLELLAADGLM